MKIDNKNNPFSVPPHFFEGLSERLMEGVKASFAEQDPVLDPNIEKTNVFDLPEGYFNQFETQMMSEIQSGNEAEAYLKSLSQENVFQVPEDYFETLPGIMHNRIHQSDEDLVDTAALVEIKGKATFQVPEGYFEQLKVQIPVAKQEERPLRTTLQPNFYAKGRWTTWVAAASILLIFSIGGAWMFSGSDQSFHGQSTAQEVAQILNSIADEDILQYIENDQESFDIYSLMDNASASTSKRPDNKSMDINSDFILDDISSEDIDAYLEFEGI